MKIRKIEGIDRTKKLCLAEMSAIGTTILALDRAQNSTAPSVEDSKEFQRRCSDAIIALANVVLEDVESRYATETKRFRVAYDVKRSGSHTMEVDAETEEDAKNLAQSRLAQMEDSEFDEMKTDFLAADVFYAEEVKG